MKDPETKLVDFGFIGPLFEDEKKTTLKLRKFCIGSVFLYGTAGIGFCASVWQKLENCSFDLDSFLFASIMGRFKKIQSNKFSSGSMFTESSSQVQSSSLRISLKKYFYISQVFTPLKDN